MTTVWDSDGCGCYSPSSANDILYVQVAIPLIGIPNGVPQKQYYYDAHLAPIIQPLPAVRAQFPNTEFIFLKTDNSANAVTLALNGADTFLGLPAIVLGNQGAGAKLRADTVLGVWVVETF